MNYYYITMYINGWCTSRLCPQYNPVFTSDKRYCWKHGTTRYYLLICKWFNHLGTRRKRLSADCIFWLSILLKPKYSSIYRDMTLNAFKIHPLDGNYFARRSKLNTLIFEKCFCVSLPKLQHHWELQSYFSLH